MVPELVAVPRLEMGALDMEGIPWVDELTPSSSRGIHYRGNPPTLPLPDPASIRLLPSPVPPDSPSRTSPIPRHSPNS